MPADHVPNPATIEALLEEGLKAYGQGDLPGAERCWRDVLDLAPTDQRAQDYLESAGIAEPSAAVIRIDERLPADRPSFTVRIRDLLAERRYEEVLVVLGRAKREQPENRVAIGRSIQHVKDKIVLERTRALGSMDQIVSLNVAPEVIRKLQLEEAERSVLEHADGISSLGDIVRSSVLERHRLLLTLSRLLELELIRLRPASFSLPPEVTGPHTKDVESLYPRSTATAPSNVVKAGDAAVDEPPPADATAGATHNNLRDTKPSLDFEETFRAATMAYMSGDVTCALDFFRQCAFERPDDERVKFNIARLTGGSE